MLASILIEQGHSSLVFDGAFEVIDAHIATKGPLGDIVMLEQRGAREADTVGRGQHVHQVIGKHAILGPVRFVTHHDDVVVGIDGLCLVVVELLDQRENERGVALQLGFQILAAAGDEFVGLDLAQHAAVLKGVADLLVQLITVSKHDDGG